MANRYRSARKGKAPKVALGGEVQHEPLLPLPFVQYPPHYGAFHGYGSTRSGPFYLCRCQESAIENFVRLPRPKYPFDESNPAYESRSPWNGYVPPFLQDTPPAPHEIQDLPFRERLCHRCHLVPPTLRWAVEMYAGQFMQYYGWYVRQAYFRLGFSPYIGPHLDDTAPPELVKLKLASDQAREAFFAEQERVLEMVHSPDRTDIPGDEATYWHNVRYEDAAEMIRFRRAASKTRNAFRNAIENVARKEFGQRAVGERWVSETQLYQIVVALLPGEEVRRHERPEWLEGLELDIWVPSRRLGIEYQGQQHFKPIEAWGGISALKDLQARDKRKRSLCENLGIILVEVDYTEPLITTHVAERLNLTARIAPHYAGRSIHS